jgi:hypothetical protein
MLQLGCHHIPVWAERMKATTHVAPSSCQLSIVSWVLVSLLIISMSTVSPSVTEASSPYLLQLCQPLGCHFHSV